MWRHDSRTDKAHSPHGDVVRGRTAAAYPIGRPARLSPQGSRAPPVVRLVGRRKIEVMGGG